jgi:hypothetical protein
MTILFGSLDLGTPDGLIMGTQKEVLTLAVYARTRTAETSNVRQADTKNFYSTDSIPFLEFAGLMRVWIR